MHLSGKESVRVVRGDGAWIHGAREAWARPLTHDRAPPDDDGARSRARAVGQRRRTLASGSTARKVKLSSR